MGTGIEDLLRLAWQADGEGKPGLRDALLTLAAAESGAENAVLAERCRRLLVARRPEHWFATSPTLGQALAHPKVAAAVDRLRETFPPVRVQRLLARNAALRGPYTGRTTSLGRIMEDLALQPDAASGPAPASAEQARSLPFPGGGSDGDGDGDDTLVVFYFTVLLAMAVLIRGVIEPASRDSKAA